MKMKMPVLFIGHGSPLNIVLENSYTRNLAALGKSLPKPKGIMVVSAYWRTNGTFVACMKKPRMIYDFYGFPKELYEMSYPSPGAPDEAEFVTKAVRKTACNAISTGGWTTHPGRSSNISIRRRTSPCSK
jgi:4,5-DOPA dioxygenase extradiol